MTSTSTKENLLILGSTGWIGAYITEQILLAKASFGRIAILTSQTSATNKAAVFEKLKARGAEIIIGDISKPKDLLDACKDIDTVVSAVGRNVIAEQVNWIPALIEAPSVKRFFPSEYGTDIEYYGPNSKEPPHQNKLKVRAALKASSGLDYTYVVTGPFAYGYLSPGSVAGIGGFDVKEKKAVLLGDGKGKISLTTEDDVGKLVVAALLHPSESHNRALKVNSFTTTPNEIAAEFQKQTGEKWDITYISLDKLKELEKQAWAEKSPVATGFTLRRIWTEGGTLYEKRDNGLIGMEDGKTDTLEHAVGVAISKQNNA